MTSKKLLIALLILTLSLFVSCSSSDSENTAEEDDGSATMEEIQEETNSIISEDPFLSFPQAMFEAEIPHDEEEANLDIIGSDDGVIYRMDDGTVGLLYFSDDSEMLKEAKKKGKITLKNDQVVKITLNGNYGLIMDYDGKYKKQIKDIFTKLENTESENR